MSWELAGNIMGPEGPPGSIADAPVTSVFGRIGAVVADPADYAAYYQPLGSLPVPGTPSLSFQYNNAGAFAGQNTLRMNGIQVEMVAGPQFTFVDNADPTKKCGLALANIPPGASRSLLIPNSTNPVAVGGVNASGGDFVTYIDNLGVQHFGSLPAAAVASVFGRTGAVVAQSSDYSSYYPLLSGSYANPSWISSLAFGKLTGVPAYEPALGNPSVSGYILSSTTAGVRSWIAAPSGGGTITLTGDVTGSGTTSIVTTIAANAVGASELVANCVGASEINNTQDLALAALQTIKVSTSGTNDKANVLGLYRNSTGTPVAGFGTRLELGAKSATVNDRGQVQLASSWIDPVDATRQAKLELYCSQGDGLFGTAVMTLYGSKGVGINGAADPGAGFFNTPSAGGYKINGAAFSSDDLATTTTNDSAAAGEVGEQKVAAVAANGGSMSNNVIKNITSISLTAGDWDVRGQVTIIPTNIASNGAEVGQANISVGTSVSIPRDGYEAINGQSNPTGAAQTLGYTMSLPVRRVSLASTTTVYLCAMTGGNAASRTGYGFIEARRVR